MKLDVTEKAAEQRQAATDAIEMLEERLGHDLPRFADLLDKASFRFRPALSAHIAGAQPCNHPELLETAPGVASGKASQGSATDNLSFAEDTPQQATNCRLLKMPPERAPPQNHSAIMPKNAEGAKFATVANSSLKR